MEGARDEGRARPRRLSPGVLAAAIVAAVAVAVVALVVALGDDGGGTDTAPGRPREVSVPELRDFAGSKPEPVYWAGPIDGTKLELTETSQGHVFIRYLPELAPVGDDKPLYATVGTYGRRGALEAVRRAGRRRGIVTRRVPGGGLAVWSLARPTSVYVAFPGSQHLIEVFHPNQRNARQLALSGRIQRVS